MFSRRRFLRSAGCAVAGLAVWPARSAESTASPPADTALPVGPPVIGGSTRVTDWADFRPTTITTATPGTCRILQVTDLHFFRLTSAEDERTLSDCRKLLDLHTPDLVVVSGDIWHDNPDGKGFGYAEFAAKAFSAWGVPWTICWGNHDLVGAPQEGQDRFTSARHSRYAGGGTHGDYRIEVKRLGEAADAPPALDLYFLNSNANGLGPWQLQALNTLTGQVAQARNRPTPALLFFHIPILDYETRLTARNFSGLKLEDVSAGKNFDGMFAAITATKAIRGCFCGHNHTNDYTVKADGVELTYGRSSGYAGYGGDRLRKGGKLIEMDLTSGVCRQTSVFADGSKLFGWRARPNSIHAA